jgi:hypothetical protein
VVLRDQTADASTVGHDSQRAVAAQVSLYGLIQRASVRTRPPHPAQMLRRKDQAAAAIRY